MEPRTRRTSYPSYFTMLLTLVLATGFCRNAGSGQELPAKVYLAEFQDNSVGVLDTRTHKVLKHIPVPKGAHGMAIVPNGSLLFVSSDESAVISVIDTKTDAVRSTIPTGKQPHGLIAAGDGRSVYAAIYGDDQVLEIDAQTLTVRRAFEAPHPHNLSLSPDGRSLYVAAQKPGGTGIGRIDLDSGAMREFIPTATVPRSLAVSPDGTLLCATLFDRNVVEFYATNPLKELSSVPTGASPHHVLFTPDGKHVLVADQVSNDITLINPLDRSVAGTVAVGQKPHWIALSSDSRYAYVTDEASNQVSVVDLEDGDVEATIAVGAAPRKIAMQTAGGPLKLQGSASAAAGTADARRTSAEAENPPEGGQSPKGGMGSERHVVVNIQGPPPKFAPETITVDAGTTVEWVNNGKGVHTVTDDNGEWDSGSLRPGEKYIRTFSTKGSFHYHCIPHASMGMVGTVEVK